jgi:hypothetical protein
MLRTSLAIVTSMLAALLVVGVAWAGSGENTDDSVVKVTSTIEDDSTSTLGSGKSSTSVGAGSSTSTTFDDDGGRTSTTVAGGSTSTSIDDDSRTSTTLDNDGSTSTSVDDRDDDDSIDIADQLLDFDVAGAATVTIRVVAGQLVLVDVDLSVGWQQEVKKLEADEIEIRFENGDSRAELEVEVEDGRVVWELDVD